MSRSNSTGMGGIRGKPSYLLVRANSLRLPVASGSVHTTICSPPYFNLRRYEIPPTFWPCADYHPMPGLPPVVVPPMTCCLGNEDSPEAFVGHLVLIFRDVWRCLHPSGSAWINLGDGFAQSEVRNRNGQSGSMLRDGNISEDESWNQGTAQTGLRPSYGVQPLNLMGIPWRTAFALQADGWTLRAAPPWIKPGSAMPESCRSRPNTAHEYVFMLTKTSKYYFDMQAVKRPNAVPAGNGGWQSAVRNGDVNRYQGSYPSTKVEGASGGSKVAAGHRTLEGGRHLRTSDLFLDSLDSAIAYHADRLAELEAVRARGGLLPGEGGEGPEAFLVNPQAYAGQHYAAFPVKLVQDMIKCSTSEHGVCGGCGAPYERVIEKESLRELAEAAGNIRHGNKADSGWRWGLPSLGNNHGDMPQSPIVRTIGWRPTCSCPKETHRIPATVLDPFSGSGVTVAVAESLGRNGIGIDLSPSYHDLARDRVERPHVRRPRERGKSQETPLFRED